ncbi:MAG: hypothetical protein ACYSW2_06615 [Planctomycetota bacterium]
MKVKTLAMAAGVCVPLILTGSSNAGFVGVTALAKPNEFGIFAVNVYAEFDNQGNDAMLGVAGTFGAPLAIFVVGGTFWNHPTFGGDLAPPAFAVDIYPSLAFDTFVTIGVKKVGGDGQPVDETELINYPIPIAGTSTQTNNGGWAVIGFPPQGNPFDPINSFPGNGSILIGQFSTTDGIGIEGTFLLQYRSDGVITITDESFSIVVCETDEQCDDGDPCNGEEICVDGDCQSVPPEPDINGNGVLDICDLFVFNATQATFHDTIAEAIAAAVDGDNLFATPLTFPAEPDIDLAGKAITLSSYAEVNQPPGGLYVLADGATLASAAGQDVSLDGELRVKTGDAADVMASQLLTGVTGEVVARSGAGLYVTTEIGAALNGETSLLPDSTMSFSADTTSVGSMILLSESTLLVGGELMNNGAMTALDADLSLGTFLNASSATVSNTTFVADSFTNGVGGEFTGYGEIFSTVTNDGLVTMIGDSVVVGDYTNNDTTIVQIGTLTIIGTLVNNGTIIGDVVTPLAGPGTQPGDGFAVTGDYVAGAAASLLMPDPVWVVSVGGNYDVAIDDNTRYDMVQAELQLSGWGGQVQTVEVMSVDIGSEAVGLDPSQPGHYPVGALRVGPGDTTVELVDNHDNDGLGQGLPEAVYVAQLVVEAGSTLNTGGVAVYFGSAQIDGTVDDPANLIQLPPPCPWDCQPVPDGEVNIVDFLTMLAQWGTIDTCDFDGDGVSITDFLLLLAFWGPCPE